MAFSVITGSSVPVFGEETAAAIEAEQKDPSQADSDSLYFASTPVPTWPAYGDQVKADPDVKVKKLTLSVTGQ